MIRTTEKFIAFTEKLGESRAEQYSPEVLAHGDFDALVKWVEPHYEITDPLVDYGKHYLPAKIDGYNPIPIVGEIMPLAAEAGENNSNLDYVGLPDFSDGFDPQRQLLKHGFLPISHLDYGNGDQLVLDLKTGQVIIGHVQNGFLEDDFKLRGVIREMGVTEPEPFETPEAFREAFYKQAEHPNDYMAVIPSLAEFDEFAIRTMFTSYPSGDEAKVKAKNETFQIPGSVGLVELYLERDTYLRPLPIPLV